MPDKRRIVYRLYRPKTQAELLRRSERARHLVGSPFIHLPGNPHAHQVLAELPDGQKIRVGGVEMVFNDMLLMDAISNWGEDGPLYADTIDGEAHRAVYDYAMKAYAGVDLPPQFRSKANG